MQQLSCLMMATTVPRVQYYTTFTVLRKCKPTLELDTAVGITPLNIAFWHQGPHVSVVLFHCGPAHL